MLADVKLGRYLEVGPRPCRLGDSWTTLGVEDNVDFKAVWGVQPLPFDDDTFEVFYACHVIEHIPWMNTDAALAEAFRVVKPGGIIELHTIDFYRVCEMYFSGQRDAWTCGDRNQGHNLRWLQSRVICWDHSYGGVNWHRAIFDAPYLKWCLEKAGFVDCTSAGEPRGPEKHTGVNLGVKAVKPWN